MASNTGDFIAEEDIFIDAENHVVEKKDARTKLASKGARVAPADVEKYGLKPKGKNAVVHEEGAEGAKALKGKLPEDFPGLTALEAAGLATYARVRKELAKDKPFDEVDGIGPATAEKIRGAIAESSEEDEEKE